MTSDDVTDASSISSTDAGKAADGPLAGEPEPVRLTGTDERPVIEVIVAAPVDAVWAHLRDPELIRRWHGWEDPGLDAEIQFIYVEHSEADDEAHVIRGRGGPAPGSYELGDRFDVEATGPQTTVVRITRGPRGTDPGWDAMYDDVTQGWTSFLAQLRFAVERHPGVDRRTVFRGRFGQPGPRALDLLGADALPTAAGSPCRLDVAGLPSIAGSLWFRTHDQIGLVVDDYGPGLVIVADKPGEDPQRTAVSMIIVSTFGLTDDEHGRVEAKWSAWWSGTSPASTG
jgi:uncharacterized protein YndB with AHSA1/START domain